MTIAGVRQTLQRAAAVLRRVIGVPDYERYVAHVHECHPDREPLTRRQFEEARMYDKYNRPGQRCC